MSDENLKPGVWYRDGALVYRLREVEGRGRYNWSAPGVRALENETTARVEGADAEAVAAQVHAALLIHAPSNEAMKAAVQLEIAAAIGIVTTQSIGALIDRVANARVREALAAVGQHLTTLESAR